MARIKTSVDLYNERKKLETKKELQQKELKAKLADTDNLVTVSIPAIYRPRLGSYLPISIGTTTITIPTDGTTRRVPIPFARALKKNLMQIDKEESRSSQRWGDFEGDVSASGPIPGK